MLIYLKHCTVKKKKKIIFSPLYVQVVGDSVAFALGLATTLALLGVGASFAGKAYGQIGQGLPIAASGLAVVMGLNLLEVMNNVQAL